MIPILVFIVILTVTILIIIGLPGSPSHVGWKLSGVWSNQSDTLQIMIHAHKNSLNGHVVSADIKGDNNKIVVGKMVVCQVKLKSIWNWSQGKYIDPYTMEEFDVKIKLKRNNKLSVCFLENKNLVKKEEWKLTNSF